MTNLITYEMLETALTPEPSDFEYIEINKTYEKEVNDRIHVGFIVYVYLADDSCNVLKDEGYCIFTIGNGYYDDYISEKEELISIDDNCLPKSVKDKWASLIIDFYESYDLEDLEDVLNQKECCASLREVIKAMIAGQHN